MGLVAQGPLFPDPGATTSQSTLSTAPLPQSVLEGTSSSTGYSLPETTDWKGLFYKELPWFLALRACLPPPRFSGEFVNILQDPGVLEKFISILPPQDFPSGREPLRAGPQPPSCGREVGLGRASDARVFGQVTKAVQPDPPWSKGVRLTGRGGT